MAEPGQTNDTHRRPTPAVTTQRGSVAELHARDPFAGGPDGPVVCPVVWWCRPTDSAVVLGSRQDESLLDLAECRRAGLNVTRRRSGGGAVVIRPELMGWIDLVVPHGVGPDDVRGSMVWAGRLWRSALAPWLDGVGTVEIHAGGMVDTAWSERVCFAGIGPGELVVAGRKLVGLSQRRTRHGLRIQGLVHRAPAGDDWRRLLRGPHPPGTPGSPAWVGGLDDEAIGRLADRLAGLLGG